MKNLLIVLTSFFLMLPLMAQANQTVMNAHQFTFESIDGEKISLSDYKGKPLLIVNTASQCGFTPQYNGLQKLWDKYKDKGLVVIGVPSNNFGGQEPGSNEEISGFVEEKFDITFQLTDKTDVVGKNAHPFYQWANKEAGFMGAAKWNFHKYLIDKDGNLAEWYSSTTKPTSSKIMSRIDELIAN